jgi:hypothetical protein
MLVAALVFERQTPERGVCRPVRGYWTVDDSGSSGEEGQHVADENGDASVFRDKINVGVDSQVMNLVTDPSSWTPECPSVHVDVHYEIGVGPGYGTPQAAIAAGRFSDDCTGVFDPR